MATPAPPAADTKKPATPPPSKAGKGGGDQAAADTQTGKKPPAPSAGQEKSGSKDIKAPGQDGKAGKTASSPGDKNTASQQRFDRMAVRAKLAVSAPGDAVEREADAVADKVMRMLEKPDSRASTSAKPQESGTTQNAIRRATDPKAQGGGDKNAGAPAAQTGKNEADKAEKTPPVAVGVPKPITTGGTKGGIATEQGGERPPEVQRKEASKDDAGKLTVPADFAGKLGEGEAMDAATRAYFENRFGQDLSQARIHTDANAQRAAADINARAFTFGRHIAFATGQYQPGSDDGKRLLAHELAHVVQQSNQTVTRQIMRQPASSAPAGGGSNEIAVKGVAIPAFKLGYYTASPYKRAANYRRSAVGSKQKSIWNKATSTVPGKFQADYGLAAEGVYVAVPKKTALSAGNADLLVGEPKTISELVRRPKWKKDGTPNTHDIDHKVELQIGGPTFDREDNLELRDSKANQSSGRDIDASITEKLRLAKDKEGGDPDKIRASPLYTLAFSDFTSGGGATGSSCYEIKDINNLDGAEGLNIYDPDKTAAGGGKAQPWPATVQKEPFFGGPDLLALYPSRRGGVPQPLKLTPDRKKLAPGATVPKTWIPGFELSNFDLNAAGGDDLGSITMTLKVDGFPNGYSPQPVPIRKLSNKLGNAGFISTEGVRNKIGAMLNKQTPVPQSSPVEIGEIDILPGSGLTITGVIKPQLPMLQGTTIDFEVSGKSFQASKTFTADEMKLPGPFTVTGSSITIAINSSAGFSVNGAMNFEIKGLGEGALKGVGATQNFGLGGEFIFDRKLFDGQAVLKATYIKESETAGRFKGEADLEIGKNKIKGIKKAKVHATIDNEKFAVSGNAETDIPGIKQFSVAVDIKDAEHFSISGEGQFDKIPGIQSGSLMMTLEREGDAWALSGKGQATPNLPGGASGSIEGTYQKGVVLIRGNVHFTYGGNLLDGNVIVAVTNADSVDQEGNASGEGGKSFKVFGEGDITAMLIKDKLFGTLKLRLQPDGSIRVGGGLKAADFEVFGKYPNDGGEFFNKTFSTPPVPLPGLGFAVGSVSVGITFSASITAKAHASVGPGKLTGISVTVKEFDPANVDLNTLEIGGSGTFAVYADAGFGVDARINLIFGAAIAELVGSVGAEAKAGIPADKPVLSAQSDFTYSQAKGLDINNTFDLNISPELKFRLFGKVSARLNIVVDTITVWEKDWTLAEANYKLPVGINASGTLGYNSKTGKIRPSNPSDAIKIEKPKLDGDAMKGIVMGDPAPPAIRTEDKSGREIPDNELMSLPPEEQVCSTDNPSFSSSPNQSVMPKREEGGETAASADENVLNRLGSGTPLDLSTRGFFEQRMKTDLSAVQIHIGRDAAREAERLSAKAFTVGEHIAFAQGEYQPGTPEGQELIAHELAHVAQQKNGGAEQIILRWPAVTRTSALTRETPATIRARTLSDFFSLTQTQLDWATSPDLQADAAALGQFRDIQTFADGPSIIQACGGLNVGGIIGKGVPAVYPALRKYTEGVTGGSTAWLRRTNDIDKAERWGVGLTTLEAAWPAANLSLVMRAPDPVSNPSPFEKLENPARPELPNFISYLTACSPILSASNGREVDSFLALRGEGAMPNSYAASITHVKNYHHFTKTTLDGLATNEAVPQWRQRWSWTQRPLTVVLYPAIDHNGAFHRNAGLQSMVTNSDILTIVVEGLASVSDYQSQLAPVASRYGADGEIQQAMIGGHGNATILQLAGTMSGAGTTIDTLGTTGAEGANTTGLMTELTRLMSGDPARRRIVLDACLTNSHQVTSALRATPADAAADVNAAIAANPSLRDVVAGMAGAGANVFGSNSSFAPAQTTFMTPGTTDIGLSVPGDPDLIASKLAYVEFGTEPEGCMRAVLECWAADQLAGTFDCRDAIRRRIGAGSSTHVPAIHADSWRESIIQPLYSLPVNHYWGNGEALRQMGLLAGSVFELFWPGHTTASSLNARLGVLSGNAAHIDQLFARVSAEPHYAATPRVALVIEQAWMQHTPARRNPFLTALGRYASGLEASADMDMGMVMAHVAPLLTLPPPVPPPADQLRLALMAAHHAPVGSPPPAPLPAHIAFLRTLRGAGPAFPAALNIDTILGGLAGENDILAAIGYPLAGGAPDPLGPPPDANIDTIRDATTRNDFRVSPLRATGIVATARDDLMVRSTPTTSTNANIFNRLPTGTRVFVIGTYGNWYAIEQAGRTGFVAKRYITLTL